MKASVLEFLAILLLGVMLAVAGLGLLSGATVRLGDPHDKITIERWDNDECIVLVDNGEEVAPVEPPFSCAEAQDEYPQANYREL